MWPLPSPRGPGTFDAVEIDPQLLAIGRQYHPAHPYQSPRVTTLGRCRQYLQDTSQHYDLIGRAARPRPRWPAGRLPSASSYLPTAGAAAARAHLAPGGTFAMYNYYAPFVLDRYATTVEDVFHRTPCVQKGSVDQARAWPS